MLLRILIALAALPGLAAAHAISLSSGELTVAGREVYYNLRMPYYEIAPVEDPEAALFANFQLYQDGRPGERRSAECRPDREEIWYLCTAVYEFPEPVERLEVECSYTKATVPNHVHVLRAHRGDVSQRIVFDFSSRREAINFVPPSAASVAFSEMWTGIVRVIAGPIQLLFLLGLALAGRSRKELLYLAGAFIAAEAVSAVVLAAKAWQISPRFIEAAAALTVAYLATEILVLPDAEHRWLVAAGMGVFHGFYFGNFLRYANMDSLYVLSGVVVAEAALLALFGLLIARLKAVAGRLRPVQSGAAVLLAVGVVWFVLRIQS